jgi:23S rRNA pseudouridine1911/1915/1917 synthase
VKHLVVPAETTQTLAHQLQPALERLVGRPLERPELERICWQGAVYVDKVRLHDPEVCPPTGTLEVFFPELLVTEFRLDPVRVVYEDGHLLAVNKPPGVNTAPSPFSDRDCLTWGVQTYLASGFAVHAVHRLDRDTSGLVLFAKSKEAEKGLHALFRERRIRKVYRALTPPFEVSDSGVPLKAYRFRDELDWRGKVQTAVTTVLREGGEGELWSWWALPHTGRPHQIRKHFARYLVPLAGDRVYAGPEATGELGLRCVSLRFRHPMTGTRLEVRL